MLYTSSAGNLGVPSGPVIVDEAGALYGTAVGQNNYGLIFQLKPPVAPTGAWTGAILHTFQGGAEGLTRGAWYSTTACFMVSRWVGMPAITAP